MVSREKRSGQLPLWVILLLLAAGLGAAFVLWLGFTLLEVFRQLNVGPTHASIQTERPQHQVTITEPLLMGETEVTIGQFKKFVESTGYRTGADNGRIGHTYASPGFPVTDDSPASALSWNDAVVFCLWLSAQEHLDPPYKVEEWHQSVHQPFVHDTKKLVLDPYKVSVTRWSVLGGNGYHLPTEAQWEYACRAGTTTQYSFGDSYKDLDKFGWYYKNSGEAAHRVALKPANAFGLHDMHGNLWEWCQDFHDTEYYRSAPSHDPTGPATGDFRVLRGGCWHHTRSECRSTFRRYSNPDGPHSNVSGFRVARTLTVTDGQIREDGPPGAIAPFDARQARQHQEAWAKHLGTMVETTNSIGMTLVVVPAGEFRMGSTDEQVESALKAVE